MSASMIACLSAAYAWSRKLTLVLSGCSASVCSAGRVLSASATVVMASFPLSAALDAGQLRARVAAQMLLSMQRSCRELRSLANERQHDVGRRGRDPGVQTQFLDYPDQRLDLHRPAAFQVLQHRHLVRAEGAGGVDASLDIDAKAQAQVVTDRLGLEHHRTTDRPRSRISGDDVDRCQSQCTDRVEAQIAAQLEPDLVANIFTYGRVEPTGHHRLMQALHAGVFLSARFADWKLAAMLVADDPGGDHLGRREDDAANRAFRTQVVPLPAARIDTAKVHAGQSLVAMEIPIGNAIACGNDAGRRTEQREHRIDCLINRVRLESDDHVILFAEFCGIVGAAKPGDMFFPVVLQTKAGRAYAFEVSPTGYQAYICPRSSQAYAEIAADRAGTEDAHLHFSPDGLHRGWP